MPSIFKKFESKPADNISLQNIVPQNETGVGFIVISMISALLTGAIAYIISYNLWKGDNSNQDLSMRHWFSVILSVAVGSLCFLALRTVFSRDAFDNPNTNAYVILTGVFSFIGITLCYISIGVWPLGESSVLIVDMYHQYAEFFALLRDKLVHGGSLIYNQSAGLGQGYLPLMAYYSSSPFNIILLLFPREYLTEAIALITMLKITFAGVSFALMVKYLFRRNDFSVAIGGIAYSMMSFFIGHSWNLMWLDPIALLPLTILGLEILLRRGKPLLYCIALALTFLTNYYMGYMVAVFLVIYFVAHMVADPKSTQKNLIPKKIFRFCYSSLIGGGISAILVVPTAIALMHTSGASDSFNRDVDSTFNLLSLFGRALFSAEPNMRGTQLPNIYCSVLAVVLLILFASCSKISLRRRLAFGGMLFFICVTASINWTDLAWHGFHFPNDLPYRYSYLISFCMLYIAMMVLDNLSGISIKSVLGGFGIFAAGWLIHQSIGKTDVSFLTIYVSLGFALVYTAVLALGAAKKIRREVCAALLLLFLFSEAAANGSSVIRQLDGKEHYSTRSAFVNDYVPRQAAVDVIHGYEQPEFRTSMLEMKVLNDPSLFGYAGITTFASSNRESTVKFMEDIGYAGNGINCYYHTGYNPFTDSLLGVKNIIFNNQVSHPQLKLLDSVRIMDDEYFDMNDEYHGFHIYENTLALPRIFPAPRGVLGWTHQKYNNPFEAQNNLATLLGANDNIYTMRTADPEAVNTNGCTVSLTDNYFSMSVDGGMNRANFTVDYTPEENALIYIYVDCRSGDKADISYDSNSWNARLDEPRIIDMGEVAAGETVSVTLTSENGCGGNIYFAELNIDMLTYLMENLGQNAPEFLSYGDHHIEATFNAEGLPLLFTSIPYDEGWSAKIDGKKVNTLEIGEALLCIEIPNGKTGGTHILELTYWPQGLTSGIIISIMSLVVLVLFAIPDERLKKIVANLGITIPEPKRYEDEHEEDVAFEDDLDEHLA